MTETLLTTMLNYKAINKNNKRLTNTSNRSLDLANIGLNPYI